MVTRIRPVVMILPALSLALLGACSNGSPSAPEPSTTAPSAVASSAPASGAAAPTRAAADATTLALAMADSSLGSILVDGKGMTLYLFTNDTPNTSNCTGPCLVAWPPLHGQPTAGNGVIKAKLGSFKRTDGTTQATYNGWPLYYWQQDTKPGDVSGQDVKDVWYVIDRDGNAVKESPATSQEPSGSGGAGGGY